MFEMDKKASNFCVDSKGYCFLCLNKIAPNQFTSDKLDHSEDNSSVYSLQEISRYLKINMSKVFIPGGPIPPHLLAKVEKSNLKVELCVECASKTESISKLCRQLQKLKMEIETGLESIHGKIREADETGRTGKFRMAVGSNSESVIGGWMEILDVLRMETMQKCSRRISTVSPRLRIQKLTSEEVRIRSTRIPLFPLQEEEASSEEILDPRSGPQSHTIKTEGSETILKWEMEGDNYDDNSIDDDVGCNADASMSTAVVVNVGSEAAHVRVKNNNLIRNSEMNGNNPQYIINPETGKYNCHLCSKEYRSRVSVNKHYNTVHRNVRFNCKICGNQFTRQDDLKIHHQSVHLGIRFQCKACQKMFAQKRALLAHQRKAGCMIEKGYKKR